MADEHKGFDADPFSGSGPVVAGARSLEHDLELAIDLVAGAGFSSRARRRHRRRANKIQAAQNKAATSIQALFRGYKSRQGGRQRMQIDNGAIIMPPRRRRRGRRAGKRKRRTSYTRRRRKSFRSRRKRRKSSARTKLRLYPGGFPKTHLIKLRANTQALITNVAGEWASLLLHPAQCHHPFDLVALANLGTTDVVAQHKRLAFTNKAAAITPVVQPYGWDHWMEQGAAGTTAESPYQWAVVEGSTFQITFVQAVGGSASVRMLGGFSGLFEKTSNSYLPDFSKEYANIDATEVSDMLNVRIMKNPQEIYQSGTGEPLSGGKTFIFNYSRKKTERRMKKAGTYMYGSDTKSNFMFTHNTDPVFNPVARFIIADIGAAAEEVTWNVFIKAEYTIRLSNIRYANESTA